jgi:hypothetical protein
MPLSPELLQYLGNVGIPEENFIASSLGERTLAFNNFTAFQQLCKLPLIKVIISMLCNLPTTLHDIVDIVQLDYPYL